MAATRTKDDTDRARGPDVTRGAAATGARRPPFAGYTIVLGGFVSAVTGLAALERSLDRPSGQRRPVDLALLGAATFKVARVVSRERLGSVVRAPFVEDDAADPYAPAAGDGLRRAIGELVTCSRCTGTWAALGLVSTQVVAPRVGRLVTLTLAAAAANDFLQAGFAVLCARAEDGSTAARTPGGAAVRKP